MRTLLLIPSLGLLLLAGACSPRATLKQATFFDASEVQGEAQRWPGARTSPAYLKRHVEFQVALAAQPADATSRMRVHLLKAQWDKAGPISVPLMVPPGARMSALSARFVGRTATRTTQPHETRKLGKGMGLDPDQERVEFVFQGAQAGEVLELICDFEIPGTLKSDARALAAIDAPTGQLLIRYDVPTDAKATMQVRGAKATPVLTRQEGKQVFALFMSQVPAHAEGSQRAYLRYVTLSASPRGYKQRFATSWSQLSAPYTKALVNGSSALRMNHREPYRTKTSDLDGAKEAYIWVRQRLQRADALQARWDEGRALPNLVTTNDLNATDKVHLMRWLLDAGEITHQVVAVRSKAFVDIDPGLPFPGAFDGAIIYLPEEKLWLDPACQRCEAGEVREHYRGAWGLTLPAKGDARLIKLPE